MTNADQSETPFEVYYKSIQKHFQSLRGLVIRRSQSRPRFSNVPDQLDFILGFSFGTVISVRAKSSALQAAQEIGLRDVFEEQANRFENCLDEFTEISDRYLTLCDGEDIEARDEYFITWQKSEKEMWNTIQNLAVILDWKPKNIQILNESPKSVSDKLKKKKPATAKDSQVKIVAALMKHHQYESDSCLKEEPIGVNQLADLAGPSSATVTRFFQSKFKNNGYAGYKATCRNNASLVGFLKGLSGDINYDDLHLGNHDSKIAIEDEEIDLDD